MKHTKVKFSTKLFLLFATLFFLMPDTSFAAAVTLQPSASTVPAGQTFSFDVSISGATSLFGAGFDLSFDPTKFTFVNATDGGFLSRAAIDQVSLMTSVSPAGNLIFGLTRLGASSSGISGSGTIAKLNFSSTGSTGSGTFAFTNTSLCILSGTSCDYSSPGSWSGATITVPAADTTSPLTTASPSGGSYTTAQSVTLSANETATIYYTLNRSTPTTASTQYTGPISISSTKTLKYFAKDAAGNSESVKSQTYTINLLDTTAPSIPASPLATAISSSQINFTWTASTDNVGVVGYKVYRCSGASCTPATQMGISTTNTYADSGLTASTIYRYAVSAYDAAGNNSFNALTAQAITQAVADTTAPVTTVSPLGRSYTTAQSVTLSANETATIYYTLDGSTPTQSSAVYFSALSIPSTKTLKYFAKDTAGNVEVVKAQTYTISIPDTTAPITTASADVAPPTTPRNVSATVVSSSQIDLIWTASTDNNAVAGYKLYRDGTQIGTIGTGAAYSDKGLSSVTTYKYKVVSFDTSSNMSSYSNEVMATTLPTPVITTSNVGGGGSSTASNTSNNATTSITTTPVPSNGTTSQTPPIKNSITVTANQNIAPIGSYNQFGSYITKKHLTLASGGDDVKKLQEFLKIDGYLKTTSTGYYGKATQAAVQAFQQEHNIAKPGDDGYGEIGIKTRAAINQHLAEKKSGTTTTTITNTNTDLLQEQIQILQQKILELLKQLAESKKNVQ